MATQDIVVTRETALARLDPQALILRALETGAGIDTLERLVALAVDVRAIQAKEAYNSAMADFHAACPVIIKTATADYQSRTGRVKYTYAPLDEIMDKVRPTLSKYGLTVSWRTPRTEPDKVVRVCRISHAFGHYEDSGEVVIPIGGADDRSASSPAQRVGVAITYADRYSLKDILGLAPEDDDDAKDQGPPEQEQPPAEPSGGAHVITVPQVKRFWAIAREHGWSEGDIKDLITSYKIEHTNEIPMDKYEAIVDKLKEKKA